MVVPVKIIDDFRYFTHEKAVYAAESLIVAVGKIPNLTDNWRPDVKSIMDLAEVTARFKSAQQEAANGDRVKAAARDMIREELNLTYHAVTHQIETIAINDPQILVQTGLKIRKQTRNVKHDVTPGIPELSATHGIQPGTAVLSAPRVQYSGGAEVRYTFGDPTVPENYVTGGFHVHTKHIEIPNLVSARTYYFQMRCIGSKNAGGWSKIVSLLIL